MREVGKVDKQYQATPADILWAKKAIVKQLSTEVKEDEQALKQQAVEDYKAGRGGQVRSPMFGNKSGWITVKEGKPPEERTAYVLEDYQKAIDWMDETRPDTDGFATDNIEAFCQWWFTQTGEQIPGFEVRSYTTEQGEPSATFTVKEGIVLPLLMENEEMRAALAGPISQMLLPGGES